MLKFLLDLIFPIYCHGCAVEGSYLCLACQQKIIAPPERCLNCNEPSLLGKTHSRCQKEKDGLTGLLVAADYRNPSVRNLIWYLKYNSVRAIAEILTTIMIDYLATREVLEYFEGSAVIPVPLHKQRKKSRGFNQAELIAAALSRRLGLTYLPILERTANSESQTDLPRELRLTNVAGIFTAAPTPSLGERKIILVDDVATTGATLNECAKVLRKQQPAEIWGLVVARN